MTTPADRVRAYLDYDPENTGVIDQYQRFDGREHVPAATLTADDVRALLPGDPSHITQTDAYGAPIIDRDTSHGHVRLSLGALQAKGFNVTEVTRDETSVYLDVRGPVAVDEVDQLVADLQAMRDQAVETDRRDRQAIHELLDTVEDCEQRLAAEGLAEWMAATGATVADWLRGKRDARDIDEDEAWAMGVDAYRSLVDWLDEVVEALEAEAADEPQRPHPSSPNSDEQRDFRAAVGI